MSTEMIEKNELKKIGEIVLNSHANDSSDLSIVLPSEFAGLAQKQTTDFDFDGKTAIFSSFEKRNHFLASYIFEKHREEFISKPSQWLKTAHDVWRHEIGAPDSVAGRLLALVHDTEDIFLIAANAISGECIEVFTVLHVVEASLPYLDTIEPKSIFYLCSVQHDKTKNDYMAGAFLSQLQKKLTGLPETCRLIHTFLRREISQKTVALHPTALLALASSLGDEATILAIEDVDSQNAILRRAALWTLGRLLVSNQIKKAKITTVINVITNNIYDSDEQVRRTAIYASAESISITKKFDTVLFKLADAGDQEVLAALSHQLFLNAECMAGKDGFKKYVGQLCKLQPTAKGAVDNFDFILKQLLEDEDQQQFVLTCLTEWVSINGIDNPRNNSFAELFNSTVFELVKRRELLSQIITDWLSSDNRKHASAAAGLLSNLWVHGVKDPEFSVTLLNSFNKSDFLFLLRRMLGFVHSEDHLISLTISLLKISDPQQWVLGFVHTALVEELGMDYPGSTTKRLEEEKDKATNSVIIELYSRTIEIITSQMNAIEALPRIEELKPPPDVQRQFASTHAKQMNKIGKESRKLSIVSQIFTEIPMKGGKGWFSYRDGAYTDASNLHPYSHSIALPRRHVLDSVGYEIRLMNFRCAKREEV